LVDSTINANGCITLVYLDLFIFNSNIFENNQAYFSISPIPTKDLITLKSDKILNKQIKILDQFGRIMLESKIESTETQIDLEQFASGIYLLQVEGIFQPARLVKE
jgi:hypothetical protein